MNTFNREFSYIAWLKKQNHPHPRLSIPPGDDTALLQTSTATLMAADMLLEGVHFDLATTSASAVGRKALAVNLSDIAAMAGTPLACTVSLALPRGRGGQLAQELFMGMQALAQEFNVAIAGGDTNAWKSADGPLVIDVAIVGDAHPRGSVLRSGAKVGDWIFVTGQLGGSIEGHHLHFTPRVREASWLHTQYGLHAMLDLSDGLASDLGHILTASGVGARLNRQDIPINPRLSTAHTPAEALEHAMNDGEDFELCFTTSAEVGQALLKAQALTIEGKALRITKVGEIITGSDYSWEDGRPVQRAGYEHRL